MLRSSTLPAMPTPKSKLSKFILSLPSTLSGSQVVERAQAKGMKTSRANVSRVRGLYGAKTVGTSAASTNAASKATATMPTTASRAKALNKSDFIRALPARMSAAEVIAKAKAEGIEIGSSLVYMVRSRSSRKAKKGATKIATSGPATVNGTASLVASAAQPSSSAAEDLLRAVAAELGLGRAVEILAGERARVQSILTR